VPFDLTGYAARIGLADLPAADAAGLAALVKAQRFAIPFENLDIPLGRGIRLDPQSVFDKLVTRRRGGYCFEQNRLLRDALEALGFEARPVLARVWLMADGVPPLTHTAVIVRIDGIDWLADAGFGGSHFPPLRLEDGSMAETPDGAAHRLRRNGDGWMLARRDGMGAWQDQYGFAPETAVEADLEMGNHWTATRPGTRFTSLCIVSIPRAAGLVALTGRMLGGPAPEQIADAGRYRAVLEELFGIELSEDEVARLGLF